MRHKRRMSSLRLIDQPSCSSILRPRTSRFQVLSVPQRHIIAEMVCLSPSGNAADTVFGSYVAAKRDVIRLKSSTCSFGKRKIPSNLNIQHFKYALQSLFRLGAFFSLTNAQATAEEPSGQLAILRIARVILIETPGRFRSSPILQRADLPLSNPSPSESCYGHLDGRKR